FFLFFFSSRRRHTRSVSAFLLNRSSDLRNKTRDGLIRVMLVLNLPFKALMFLTLMRPSLVLFLVLWLKLVKDFLKVRCRLALLQIGRASCREREYICGVDGSIS